MNISPYDNLPTGDKDPKQENPQQAEGLQYVDVPLDELAAEASGEAVPPRQSAEEGAGEITLPEVSRSKEKNHPIMNQRRKRTIRSPKKTSWKTAPRRKHP